MVTWGVDLGVRSATLAGIGPGDRFELLSIGRPTPKGKISDQGPHERWVELAQLARTIHDLVHPGDFVYLEEPPVAGARNLRTYGKLSMAAGAVTSASQAPVILVPVDTWKMAVLGKGGLSKDEVSRRLCALHPKYSLLCDNDQNRVDATCLALYGLKCEAT